MSTMIKWRQNKLKHLIKLNASGKISNDEYFAISEKILIELWALNQMK